MLPCNGQPGPSSSAASQSGDAPSVVNLYDASVGTEFLNAFEQCAQASSTANIPVDVSMLRGMDYAPYASPAFAERTPIQQHNQMDPNARYYNPINTGHGHTNMQPSVYSQAVRYPMPDQVHWTGMLPPTMASNATYAIFPPQSAQGPSNYAYSTCVPQIPQGPASHPYVSFVPPNPHGLTRDPFSGRIAGLLQQELPVSSLPTSLNAPSCATGNTTTLAEVLQSTTPSTFRHEGFDYSFLGVASDGLYRTWRCQFYKRRCLGTLREDVLTKTYTLTRKHNHPHVAGGGGSSDTTPQLSRCPSVVEAEPSQQHPTASSAVKESEDELPTDIARQTPPTTVHRVQPPPTAAPVMWTPPSNPPARSALPALNLDHYRDDTCLARIWERNDLLFGDSATFHNYWPEYAGIEHVFRSRRDRFFTLKDDLESTVPTSGLSGEERKAELACARIELEKSVHRLIRFLVLARSVPQDLRRCLEDGMGFNSIFRQLRLPGEQVLDPLRNDLYDWNEDPRGQQKRSHLFGKMLKAENVVQFRCLFEGCPFTTDFNDQRTQKSVNATLRKHYYKHARKSLTSQSSAPDKARILALSTKVPDDRSLVSTPTSDGIPQQGFPESAFATISKYIETTFSSDPPGENAANVQHAQEEEAPASAHPLEQDEVQDDAVEMVTIEINNSFSSTEPCAAELSPTLEEFLNFVEPSVAQEQLLEKGLDDSQKETTGSSDCSGTVTASDATGYIEPANEIETGNNHATIEAEPSQSHQADVRPMEDANSETSSSSLPPENNSPPQAPNRKARVSKMTIRMQPLHAEDIPLESRVATTGACETGTPPETDTIMRKEASQDRSSDESMETTSVADALEPVSVAPGEPVVAEAASRTAEDTAEPSGSSAKSICLSPSKMTVRMRPLRPTDDSARSPEPSRPVLVGRCCTETATVESDDDDNVCDGEAQSDGPLGSPFTTDGVEDRAPKATDEADAVQAEIEGLPESSLEATSLDELAPADYLQFFEKDERRRWKCRFVDCDYSNNSHAPMANLRQMLKKHCQEVHFSGV